MDKKINLLFILVWLFASCKKNCVGNEKDITIYPQLPDNVWLDSIENGAKYNYYYISPNGLSDLLSVERTDFQYHMQHLQNNDCAWVYYISFRASFVSQNYMYSFDLQLDDADVNGTDEVQAKYRLQPDISYYKNKVKHDKFIVDTNDSSKNRVSMVNYNIPDSSAVGHCSILSTYTTSAGQTFNNVYKFTPLSTEKNFSEPSWIKEFYATKQLGIIEYKTKSGITFSFIRREKL